VDESQADVVALEADLAYPGADRAAAFFEVVTEAFPVNRLGCAWSNGGNDVSQLQDDVLQARLRLLEKLVEVAGGEQ